MGTTSPAETARSHTERARATAHGRSAHTVHGDHQGRTLDAITDSAVLLTVGLVLGTSVPVAVAGNAGPGHSRQEDWN
jgi:hypothetical protein